LRNPPNFWLPLARLTGEELDRVDKLIRFFESGRFLSGGDRSRFLKLF
jgi:hypothetical protein